MDRIFLFFVQSGVRLSLKLGRYLHILLHNYLGVIFPQNTVVYNFFELLQINEPAPDPLEKFKTMDSNFTIQELEDFNPTKDFAKTVESNMIYVIVAAIGKDYCIDGWNTRFCQCQLGEDFKS